MRGKALSREIKDKVMKYLSEGHSIAEAATRFGLHYTTVYCWVRKEKGAAS
jgi:transposase